MTLACSYQGFIGNRRGTFSKFPGKYFYTAENTECSVTVLLLSSKTGMDFIYEAFNKLKSGSIDIYSFKFDSDKTRSESDKWD